MSLEILLTFAQILIPISLALPAVLALIPERASDVIVALLYVPIFELWVTVGVALSQLPLTDATAGITGVTIVFATLVLTVAYFRLGHVILIWNSARAAEAEAEPIPSTEDLLTDILEEVRRLRGRKTEPLEEE